MLGRKVSKIYYVVGEPPRDLVEREAGVLDVLRIDDVVVALPTQPTMLRLAVGPSELPHLGGWADNHIYLRGGTPPALHGTGNFSGDALCKSWPQSRRLLYTLQNRETTTEIPV